VEEAEKKLKKVEANSEGLKGQLKEYK